MTILYREYELGTLERLLVRGLEGFFWTSEWKETLLYDVARGLEFMHQNSIAHCDIRAATIHLSMGAARLFAALGDFDFAKTWDESQGKLPADEVARLQSSSRIRYASPEVIQRFKKGVRQHVMPNLIKAADLFAFGMVMSEVVEEKIAW
jgi:serine/threonine protein kinase